MKNKKVVRLTESQLHDIIGETIKRVLKEENESSKIEKSGALLRHVVNFAKNILGNLFLEITQKPGYISADNDYMAYGLIIGLNSKEPKITHKAANKFCSEVESNFNVGARIIETAGYYEIAIWDNSTLEPMDIYEDAYV